MTFIAWDEVPHLSADDKATMAESYMPHERDARTKGIPQLGAGAIYPVPESEIVVAPFEIPAWWPRSYALDVGWNRTAAVWGALDRETETSYLYAEYYRGQAEPSIHAAAIRAHGDWMTGAIDPASRGRGQADGRQLLQDYIDLGLVLVPAANAVESGLLDVWQRLSTGRLKVFATMQHWLTEFRLYRRDEKGHVVKEMDHLMDASRYWCTTGINIVSLAPDYLKRSGLVIGGTAAERGDYDPWQSMNSEQPRPW